MNADTSDIPLGTDWTSTDQAHSDFASGCVDAIRTLACIMIRAGLTTAAELHRDFAERAATVHEHGDIRAMPTRALAAAMAALAKTGCHTPPAEGPVVSLVAVRHAKGRITSGGGGNDAA